MMVKAQDVKQGMRTPWWSAIADAEEMDKLAADRPRGYPGRLVRIMVQFIPDGSRGPRYFDLDKEIDVTICPCLRGDSGRVVAIDASCPTHGGDRVQS
jgi:hypothetical protein